MQPLYRIISRAEKYFIHSIQCRSHTENFNAHNLRKTYVPSIMDMFGRLCRCGSHLKELTCRSIWVGGKWERENSASLALPFDQYSLSHKASSKSIVAGSRSALGPHLEIEHDGMIITILQLSFVHSSIHEMEWNRM